jgi:hypothetical protein
MLSVVVGIRKKSCVHLVKTSIEVDVRNCRNCWLRIEQELLFSFRRMLCVDWSLQAYHYTRQLPSFGTMCSMMFVCCRECWAAVLMMSTFCCTMCAVSSLRKLKVCKHYLSWALYVVTLHYFEVLTSSVCCRACLVL